MWKQIVNSKDPGHFRRAELPLLEKYCMAEAIYWQAMDHIFAMTDEQKETGDISKNLIITTTKGYELPDTYLTIANKQVQLQTALATKLRIATNARVSKDKDGAEKESPKSKRRGMMYGEGE